MFHLGRHRHTKLSSNTPNHRVWPSERRLRLSEAAKSCSCAAIIGHIGDADLVCQLHGPHLRATCTRLGGRCRRRRPDGRQSNKPKCLGETKTRDERCGARANWESCQEALIDGKPSFEIEPRTHGRVYVKQPTCYKQLVRYCRMLHRADNAILVHGVYPVFRYIWQAVPAGHLVGAQRVQPLTFRWI